MNNPDYFKLSHDQSLDNFNPMTSSREREGEVYLQPEGQIAAEGALGPMTAHAYQNVETCTPLNMQSQEEQGNANNDHAFATTTNNAPTPGGTGTSMQ